jgi:guanine deaminase
MTLTAHLSKLSVLGPDLVAAHAIWLTDDDTRLLAEHGVSVAHNPASNLKLGNGVAPVRAYLAAGVNVGVGTDGSASSDNQNIIEAMRYASNVSRLRSMRPDEWLDGPTTLAMTVQGGARCCGQVAPALGLAVGDPADIVLLRKDAVALQPANDLRAQLVHAENGAAVDTVLVAGEVVLRGGVATRVDEATIRERAQEAIARVRRLNAAEWELARRLTPYIVQTCSALAATPYPVARLLLEKSTPGA